MTGDPRLAERLLANLVDNALAYNSTPGRIDMMTGRRGDVAFVSITNTGQSLTRVLSTGSPDHSSASRPSAPATETGRG